MDNTGFDSVLYNDGFGTFEIETLDYIASVSSWGGNVHFADFNNDGYPEIGVATADVFNQTCPHPAGVKFEILDNEPPDPTINPPPPHGQISDPHVLPQNYSLDTHDFAFVDVNNDGRLDLFMGLCDGYRLFVQKDP